MVKLDAVLSKILKSGKSQYGSDILISFESLFSELFDKLSPMHCIIYKYSDNKEREPPVLKKGKFKPVEFKLEARGGNKKLTVIHHLDEFSIDPKELVQKIRTKVGCSASIDNSPSGASNVSDEYTITVQGNQISQVSRLLKSMFFDMSVFLNFKPNFYLRRVWYTIKTYAWDRSWNKRIVLLLKDDALHF